MALNSLCTDASKDSLGIYLNDPAVMYDSDTDDIISNCSRSSLYYGGDSFSSLSPTNERDNDVFLCDNDPFVVSELATHQDELISNILLASSNAFLQEQRGNCHYSYDIFVQCVRDFTSSGLCVLCNHCNEPTI